MIGDILALIPTYGVWLIMVSVALSCLALPIPSSMLVMAAGGFAAAGDFAFWHLVLFAFTGFAIGDQVAFGLARAGGGPLVARIKYRAGPARVLREAETLLDRRGILAVLLSRTILSPLGPYVTFMSGALGLVWWKFTMAAVIGGAIWAAGYSWLGYAFASHIDTIAALIESTIGIILAGSVVIGLLAWLLRSYHAQQARPERERLRSRPPR